MARKSRKNVNQETNNTVVTAPYTMTGIYVRLSIENSGEVMKFTWENNGHKATLTANFGDYSYSIEEA